MSKAHLLERLHGSLEGDLFLDLPRRLLYSTSASSNSVVPSAVVRPKSAADVRAVVQFCREEGIPITPRGAATGMSGANQGHGVVLDFIRYMRRVTEMDSAGGRVRVQPGVVYGDLNKLLAPLGLFLPPDPSSGAYCTLGGMVANNAAGAHTVKYGPTRDYLLSIDGVDAQGEFRRFERVLEASVRSDRRFAKTWEILDRNRLRIADGYPRVTKNASGYLLQGALEGGVLDLPKMLCGSEGTLALFTEIELRVVRQPTRRCVLFASFETLEEAGRAVVLARALIPSALEILDRSLIQEILKTKIPMTSGLSPRSEAALLVEFDGESDEELRRFLRQAKDLLGANAASQFEGWDTAEQKKIWDLRKGAAVKARREDWKKPIRVVEDAAVPLDRIADYIRGVRRILEKRGAEAILVGHAGNGNIHVEPLLDVRDPGLKETVQALASEVSDLVRELGGTLSGEHGDGIVRSPYLPKIYPELISVFEQIKQCFDPQGIFNPGVILPYPKARSLTEELRYGFSPVKTGTPFDDLFFEVERCFSCGVCRNYCPAYADSGEEESLPRARAGLLRGLLAGLIAPDELFGSQEARHVFELCFNCGRCAPECPAGFDSARLATIAKGVFESRQGLSPVERLLTTPAAVGEGLHRAKTLLPLLDSAVGRQMGEAFCGVSAQRDLPVPSDPPLRSLLRSRGPSAGGLQGGRGSVVYFPGCWAEYNDPVGEGLGTIFCLEQNGYSVELAAKECCGIAELTTSGFERIRERAENIVRDLQAELRSGKKVVVSSPSCGHAITEEYPYFLRDGDSRSVATGTQDAGKLLANLLDAGELSLPGSLPLRVAYHNPCHLRVRGLGPEATALLRAIPELELVELPDRCCGMAGTFGAKERHFDRSMAIASPQVESIRKAQVAAVVSGCGTCQMQFEHAADLPTVHPLALLAAAYGSEEVLRRLPRFERKRSS